VSVHPLSAKGHKQSSLSRLTGIGANRTEGQISIKFTANATKHTTADLRQLRHRKSIASNIDLHTFHPSQAFALLFGTSPISFPDRFRKDRSLIKGEPFVFSYFVGFMSLSRKNQNVSLASKANRIFNGLPSIHDHVTGLFLVHAS
jgi:hypothetical protein